MTEFHYSESFPFAAELARRWREIRDEYLGVQADMVPWYERDLYSGDWKVFGLFDYPHGNPIGANTLRCPITSQLVRSVPRHGAAGFSTLSPMTRIHPHAGYQGSYLRCHLGLVVPEGDCAIKVGGKVRRWREGEVLVFDDRGMHEAWNATRSDRVVLLIDFVPF